MKCHAVLVTFSAIACLAVSARAENISSPLTVIGHGDSDGPSCGDTAGDAEKAADQHALSQCKTGGIQRISDYTTSVTCYAHGYYGVSHASAEYQCTAPTVDGHGEAQTDLQGDEGTAKLRAEANADQNAQSQCTSITGGPYVQRLAEYKDVVTANPPNQNATADANYSCIAQSSPLDARFVGQAESQDNCGPGVDLPALISSTQNTALRGAQLKCRGGNVIRLSDFTDNHSCTPLNVNYDRHLEVIESAVFLCTLAHG